MYEQIREDILYIMLYAVVTATALMACCYLLFRRGNAFAPDVMSPVRLRRWTAAFFAVFVVNHLWYMLPSFFLTSSEDIKLTNLAGGLLDSITFFPLAVIVMLTMLQDRQRPLWPAWAMVMPVVVGMTWCVASQSDALLPILIAYLLLMIIGLTIYMVRTNEVMAALGCKTVADLQKVDVEKLVTTAASMLALRVWAERDGNLLPKDPYEAYANGAAKDLTFLQGCTKDELGYFIYGFGLETYNEWAADRKAKKLAQLADEEKALVESYCQNAKDVSDEYSSTSRLFDQIVFIAPLFRLLENQTKAGGKSYAYFFTVESSVPYIKSGHAVELSTIFNHPEETLVTGRQFDTTFGKTLRKLWVQFAKTGNPSLSADESPDGKAKEWPLYDTKDRNMMILDEKDIHLEKESERKILDWDRTYFLTKYYCI